MVANHRQRGAIGPRNRSELNTVIILGLIICLALGLRLFQLGHQELRGDEAFDALFSAQGIGAILDQLRANQPYPPLFHVALHYWLGQVGQSEVTQRLPAVLSGVLLVPLAYQLARLTLGRTTGIIAALLVAVNPFYIWHAQDGRMYSLLAMLSTASIWLGLLLLQRRSKPGLGFVYWAVTVMALLTHYFAVWVVLAENVAALLVIWKQDDRRKLILQWLVWQVLVVLALVPWLLFASGLLTSHTSTWIPPLSPLEMIWRSLTTFSLGLTLEPTPLAAFSVAMGILFVLGCLFPSRSVEPGFRGIGRGLVLIFVGVPLLATMLLSLMRPAFDEKYLIAVVACYLILVAHGLHFLATKWKWLGVAVGVVILVGAGWSILNYYNDPAYAKSPSWRDLVSSINARAAEGDVIVRNYPDPGFQYYYDGDLPARLLPVAAPSPEERTSRALEKLAGSYRRIWLIPSPGSPWDPEGDVQRWLTRHADLVDEQAIGTLQLQLYQTPLAFQEGMAGSGIRLGPALELVGYRLAPADRETVAPGQQLSLTLYWRTLAPVDADYTVFVHLADSAEQIWGQHDGQPVGGTFPITGWLPGQIVVDQHTIEIDAAAPTGRYRLMVGLYDGENGQRLAISSHADAVDGDRIVIETIELAAPTGGEVGGGDQGP